MFYNIHVIIANTALCKYRMEEMILLKCLNIWSDTNMKTILLDHQNNYVKLCQIDC